jgi:hypothetical protein
MEITGCACLSLTGQQPQFTEFIQAVPDASGLLPSDFQDIGAGDASRLIDSLMNT